MTGNGIRAAARTVSAAQQRAARNVAPEQMTVDPHDAPAAMVAAMNGPVAGSEANRIAAVGCIAAPSVTMWPASPNSRWHGLPLGQIQARGLAGTGSRRRDGSQ